MSHRSAQSGQALVGTLALMVLVFGLAGGIAFAASTLLEDQNSHRAAIARNLRAQDVVSAEVASVAGRGAVSGQCQSMATWDILPDAPKDPHCLRIDQVAAPALETLVLHRQSGCASAPVPASQGKNVWLFFNALRASGITVWVDESASCPSGNRAPAAICSKLVPGGGQIAQVSVSCDLGDLNRPFVHVANGLSSPSTIRITRNSGQTGQNQGATDGDAGGQSKVDVDGAGSIYELAATTGPDSGTYEEAFVFVSRDGRTTQLLAEGLLG